MENQTFKRRVAKTVTRYAVSSVIATAVAYAANLVVDPDEDDISNDVIAIGSMTTGFVASIHLEPYTDAMVDRIADWRITRKAEQAEHPES